MHRIDSSTATPDNRFTEGDPTIPVPATTVTDDWLNAVQEELIAILAAANVTPDKANNAQVLAAIQRLIADKTGIAKVGVNGLVNPDGVTIKIDATGKISVVQSDKYDLGEFYYFRHPTLKPGFAPLQGGLISGVYQGKNITEWPIWEYLQTADGQLLLKTEAEWHAMTTAIWHTNADGTTVGWDGIGGAPYYVQDLGAGTLRMPDVRGMYAEAAGFDSLGVGALMATVRNATGGISSDRRVFVSTRQGCVTTTLYETAFRAVACPRLSCRIDLSLVMPTGAVLPSPLGRSGLRYLGSLHHDAG
ncbi:hypothetical protein [Desulfovibrio sp. G11]|uniref:hypothetical protein n=1 Tax=Desulfovibrio sp. G11 TaxID=631220 RepID=UPI000BB704AE|nr:hypothetical protein [Desulfovibrio sp. G11]ATD82229.1 hypothetical protein CNY67_13180 [Desulfovibrio sp. G11]